MQTDEIAIRAFRIITGTILGAIASAVVLCCALGFILILWAAVAR